MTTTPTMTLYADDLASKWGFNDGEIPDPIWDYFDTDGRLEYIQDRWHDILRHLVRKHLVPLLPEGVDVYDINTIHNPIRTDHWGDPVNYMSNDAPNIEVTVTVDDILAATEEIERLQRKDEQ